MDRLAILPVPTIDATIHVPGSKSYTNRYLAIAALSGKESEIDNALLSDDTTYLAQAISAFGHVTAEVDSSAARVTIRPTGRPMRAPTGEIYVGGAGTPLRFLISLAGHASGQTIITGNARMQQRPMGDLLSALAPLGVDAVSMRDNGSPPVRVQGGSFRGGSTIISGSVSSQFTSSLLISSVKAAQNTNITISDDLISKPYVDMTIAALADAGVTIGRDGYRNFTVRAGQELRGGRFVVEPDASGMSYFLAAAAILGGRVTVPGIGASSSQGDIRLLDALQRMGCRAEAADDHVAVTGGELHAIDIDMESTPDVVPTLAIVAAFAQGTTRISNIASLRIKECDRISAIATELGKMGIAVREFPDALHITGGIPHGGTIETYDDHRIAMAFAIAGLRTSGVVISDPGCVAKSFPSFWQVLDRLNPSGGCSS